MSPSTARCSSRSAPRRQRNLACTPALVQDARHRGASGGFTRPDDRQPVQLQSHGVFAQRFHINIDFDSKRDYAAGNIISVYYQGLEDEKLQRVDIGTVQSSVRRRRGSSRRRIPSNNFGISATAVFGPLDGAGNRGDAEGERGCQQDLS